MALGLGLISLSSCEKDTGDVGLNTLPPEDGFYIFEDSVKLTGFMTVSDTRIFTEDKGSIMIGSVAEKTNANLSDTLVAECDIPLFFPQNPGNFSRITEAKAISLIFFDSGLKYGGYKYGDTLKPITIDVWGVYGAEEKVICSFEYFFDKSMKYRNKDTVKIPLGDDLLNFLIEGISTSLNKIPTNASGYYSTDSSLLAKKYFFENYFKGIKLRVKSPSDAFVARIFNPHFLIDYSNGSKYDQEFMLLRGDLKTIDTIAIQREVFTYPGAIFSHSSKITDVEGAFIQGGASTRTIIDMSPIGSWKDSTSMLVNKATITFKVDKTDNRAPLERLRFTMYNKADMTPIFTSEKYYNDSLNAYCFEINKMLNSYISKGIPIENYEFDLACPVPNATVNKTTLQYKEGVSLNIVYSKY